MLKVFLRGVVFPVSYCQIANTLSQICGYITLFFSSFLASISPVITSAPCFPNVDKSKQKKVRGCIRYNDVPSTLALFHAIQYTMTQAVRLSPRCRLFVYTPIWEEGSR